MKKINAKKLLDLMFESGQGIREVAKAAGVSASLLSAAIRHGRQCYLTTIGKLAKYFGVDPNELIDPADQLN